jgi:hypothetical protein
MASAEMAKSALSDESDGWCVINANCRGQMVYADFPFKIQTIGDTLEKLSSDQKEKFADFLRTKVKYASCSPPGVCGHGLSDEIQDMLLAGFGHTKPEIDSLLSKLRSTEPEREEEQSNHGSPEKRYRLARNMKLWQEYPLHMEFPDKYLRFCPRKDIPNDKRVFTLYIDNKLVTLKSEYIMLSELLFHQFEQQPLRPVFFPDASCFQLAKIKNFPKFPEFPEIDASTRLINFTTKFTLLSEEKGEEEIDPLNDILTKITGGRKTRKNKSKRRKRRNKSKRFFKN